jgi:ABC-2 type transport system permease protein
MRGTFVIFKKELAAYFLSPLFYFISFLMTSLLSIMFAISLDRFHYSSTNAMMQLGTSSQQQNIHFAVFLPHLSLVNLMMIFLVPALCMRLLSEEKKMRTFDLLLTSPITSIAIVLGKYLATLVTIFGLIAVTMIYPVITSHMVDFPWAPTVIAALGIFLASAVYAAMNLFASSLTDNGLIAFVLSIVFNLAIWFVGALNESFDEPTTKKILEHLSINTHLSGLIEGTVRSSGVVFIFSLIFLFCFLTERVIESSRWRA